MVRKIEIHHYDYIEVFSFWKSGGSNRIIGQIFGQSDRIEKYLDSNLYF